MYDKVIKEILGTEDCLSSTYSKRFDIILMINL